MSATRTVGTSVFLITCLLWAPGPTEAGEPFLIGEERDLLVARGPFAVDGDPDGFLAAWIETQEEFTTLWVGSFEGGEATGRHLVAGAVDPEAGILLAGDTERALAAWRAEGVWKLARLERNAGGDLRLETFRIGAGLRPLALDSGGEGLPPLMLLAPTGSGATPEAEAGAPAELALPPIESTALVALDLERAEGRLLRAFPEGARQASLDRSGGLIALTLLEEISSDLIRIELDELGAELGYEILNTFPVARFSEGPGGADGSTRTGWVESRPEGMTALLASPDGSEPTPGGRTFSRAGREAGRLALGGDEEALLVWEEAGTATSLRLLSLDAGGAPRCESEIRSEALEALWVLGGERGSLLLRSRALPEGGSALTLQPLTCPLPGSEGESGSESSASLGGGMDTFTPPSPPPPDAGLGESILGGSEDICDGYDNDGDSAIDEGCDGICNYWTQPPTTHITSTATDSRKVDMVWNGYEYGMVWEDLRHGAAQIYFARMGPSGNRIGSEVRVTNTTTVCYNPTMVWTGSEYGVAWGDHRDGNREIYFARLYPEGNKKSPPGDVRITNASLTQDYPSIAWSGSQYGILWQDNRNSANEIYFARVSGTGSKIGGDVRVTVGGNASSPDLVWGGVEYALAWHNWVGSAKDIHFGRISSGGTVLGQQQVTSTSGSSTSPSLAWNGSGYGVAWTDDRSDAIRIYFALLDSSGVKLGNDRRITFSSNNDLGPSLVWTGQNYAVAYVHDYPDAFDIRVKRISASGSASGDYSGLTGGNGDSLGVVLVWNGDSFATAFHDDQSGDFDIHVARLRCCDDNDGDGLTECYGDPNDEDPDSYFGGPDACDGLDNDGDGTIDESCQGICGTHTDGDDQLVSITDADARYADMAWGDDEYGLAWIERESGCKVMFRRVDEAGLPLGSSTEVYDCLSTGSEGVRVAWTGAEYGVLYALGSSARFSRLSPTGTVLASNQVSSLSFDFRLVWNGSEYGVLQSSTSFYRIDRLGNQMNTPFDIIPSVGAADAVWTGDRYALVYRKSGDLRFSTVDYVGGVLDPETVVENYVSGNDLNAASITWTGSGYGVTWQEERSWGDDDIQFRRLDSAGTPLGARLKITTFTSGVSQKPRVVWTGEEYGITWMDDYSGLDWVYLQRVSAAGVKAGTRRQPMDPYSTDAESPVLVWNGYQYGLAALYRYYISPGVPGGDFEVWFQRVRCCGINNDGDPSGHCQDCDDWDSAVYPGASQACDGVNNDCNDAQWPDVPASETDDDGDTWAECAGDCNDADGGIYPGATQVCDGLNNDCDHASWPGLANTNENDDDGDTMSECAGDCDDDDGGIYPGATQLCDGVNNDCNDGSWPIVPVSERDDDGDGLRPCSGDCNDGNAYCGLDCTDGDADSFCVGFDCDDLVYECTLDCTDADADLFPACAGDCDEGNGTVYPGAPQLCDGLNNDCDDGSWPIVPADEADGDDDGYRICHQDCDDVNDQVWATPGLVRDLTLATDGQHLDWVIPEAPGGIFVVYDTIRSDRATDFLNRGICIETDDGSDTSSYDPDTPWPGQTLFYAVRAENDCPQGQGSIGLDTEGEERLARSCP